MTTSVYVHVPFCVVKCGYCDFNSYTVDGPEPLDQFLLGLDQELRLAPLPKKAPTIFIGGGTPTYLDQERFAQMLEILNQHLDLHSCAEVTMEANPESVTAAKADLARQAGINRISIGAQSFATDKLRFLDRAHSAEQTRQAFHTFREAGFGNISLDLIFGLPGQSLAQWQDDLQQALALQPDHLSCYSLTYEPGTRLHRDLKQGRVQVCDEDQDREMFLFTRDHLAEHGFTAYEVSNFAGQGGPCMHNDHYWLQGDYIGIGPGAAEHRRGVRHTNLKALQAWADSLAKGLRPVASAETLSLRQRAAEALWLGIRRKAGIALPAIEQRLGIPLQTIFQDCLEKLCKQGYVTLQDSHLSLTKEGLLFANTVGETFLTGYQEPSLS